MSETPNDISRRDLLRGAFLRAAAQSRLGPPSGPSSEPAPASAPSPRSAGAVFPVLRPPCAVDEQSFLEGCNRCYECIKACPPDAFDHAPARFRGAAGTPYIEALANPCWMCEDTPCVSACEPGVLHPDLPKKMGDALIHEHDCLAHQGTFCSVCFEQCPVEGALSIEDNVPIIHQDVCTGCGVCQHVCPAPINAVIILPVRDRPNPPMRADAEAEGEMKP